MLTKFYRWLLQIIVREFLRSETQHDKNVQFCFETIIRETKNTFTEDNCITIRHYIDEAFDKAFITVYPEKEWWETKYSESYQNMLRGSVSIHEIKNDVKAL